MIVHQFWTTHNPFSLWSLKSKLVLNVPRLRAALY
ncbi:hypothetical protein SAMN05421665_3235 [Yoonia rosea]|uniref:Uncharacterized protein n=1 Tax=Yoonia rosea TaxID=287098 RepID=A0A1R3XHA0_9RHOB|nr:hypothetical protein SAMN05421665_3235 [Yoonia rosea]